jgi:hypothetical protein
MKKQLIAILIRWMKRSIVYGSWKYRRRAGPPIRESNVMPNFISRILLALSLLALVAACSSTPTAMMDFDPGFDFSGVRTIAIKPVDRSISPASVLSGSQITRMNRSLTDELVRRGFDVVPNNGNADMLLAWHLVTQERTDVRTHNSAVHYSNCWNCRPMSSPGVQVTQYIRGTLIVDLLDPAAQRSVWRSIFESRLRDQPDAALAAEVRREAAEAVFAEFPPQ